jgi:chromosome segregation ATPase
MGRRKGLVKTKTIRQRRIDVYLPSLQARDVWTKAAEARNQSVSQMVFELVHTSLTEDRESLEKELQKARKELTDAVERTTLMNARIGDLEALKERLEAELERYRTDTWTKDLPTKKLDGRLLRAFSTAQSLDGKRRTVGASELRQMLRIKPDDVDALKALNEQLAVMELHELVTRTAKGWIWNG